MKYKILLLIFSFSLCIPDFSFSQSTATLCSGSPLCISGYSTGIWDGGGISSLTTTCINPTITDTYTCQTITTLGLPGPILTYSVTILDKPVLSFTTTAPALCGDTYSFSGSASIASSTISSTMWNFGSGTDGSFPLATFHYTVPGTYSVTLIAQSAEGCSDSVVQTLTIYPSPNLSFTNSSACTGATTNFTNTSTIAAPGSISSYTWNLGNSVTSNAVNPSGTYSFTGVQTVTLSASSAQGCSISVTQTLMVFSDPQAGFSTTNLCSDKPIAFTPSVSSTSGSITAYVWTFSSSSGTLYSSANSSPAYSFTPGNYTTVLGVTSEHGCFSTQTQTLTITPTPTVSFSTQVANLCSPTVTFAYTGAGQNSYSWNYDGVTAGTSTETIFVYPAPGIYTASAIGISSEGCADTVYQSLTIYPPPSINFTLANTCFNTTFTISSAPSASITSRVWDFGEPTSPTNTSTLALASHSYSNAGTYSLTLTLSDSLSCISQTVIPVIIYPNPFITISSGTLCRGSSFTLNPSGASTYTYLTGAAVVSPTSNSTYSVIGRSAFGCAATNTAVSTLTVYTVPGITVANATICSGSVYSFTGTGASVYSSSGGTTNTSPASTTVYSITGTSAQGCASSNSPTMTLVVNPIPTITVNSGTICSGKSFTIMPVSTNTYAISGGTNIVSPTTNTFYTATATNSFGCSSSVPSNISVLSIPMLAVNSGSICSGNVFTLSPSGALSYTYSSLSTTVAPTTNSTYIISGTGVTGCTNSALSSVTVYATPTVAINNGAICSGKSFTLSPTGATTYSYWSGAQVVSPTVSAQFSVTGTSVFGCTNIAVSHVTVFVTPTITVNSSTLCQGNSFTLVPAGASSYMFSSGSAVVSPTSNTSYTVTGTSVEGCTNTALSHMTVYVSPVVSVNSGSICLGSSFTLNPGGASTYTFSNGAAVISPTSTASYTVTGTNTLGCINKNTAVSTVSVYTFPTIQVLSTNSAMCVGETSTLLATGAISYTWQGHTPAAYIFITPSVSTAYTVTASNNTGCLKTEVYTQNVFLCAGIVEAKTSASFLTIYPNPNNGVFTIKSDTDIDLKLLNTLGQTLRLLSLNASSDYKAEVNDLEQGVYFMSSQDGTRLFKQKIIVTR